MNELQNKHKVKTMLEQHRERIALRCHELYELHNDKLLNIQREEIALRAFKKQHPFFRCYFEQHLNCAVREMKSSINEHVKISTALLKEITYLKQSNSLSLETDVLELRYRRH